MCNVEISHRMVCLLLWWKGSTVINIWRNGAEGVSEEVVSGLGALYMELVQPSRPNRNTFLASLLKPFDTACNLHLPPATPSDLRCIHQPFLCGGSTQKGVDPPPPMLNTLPLRHLFTSI